MRRTFLIIFSFGFIQISLGRNSIYKIDWEKSFSNGFNWSHYRNVIYSTLSCWKEYILWQTWSDFDWYISTENMNWNVTVIGFFIAFLLSNKIPPQDLKGGVTVQWIFSVLQPPKLPFFYLLSLIFVPIIFYLIDHVGKWKNAYIAASIPAW